MKILNYGLKMYLLSRFFATLEGDAGENRQGGGGESGTRLEKSNLMVKIHAFWLWLDSFMETNGVVDVQSVDCWNLILWINWIHCDKSDFSSTSWFASCCNLKVVRVSN